MKVNLEQRIVRNRQEADRLDEVIAGIDRTRRSAKASMRDMAHETATTRRQIIPTSMETPESSTIVRANYDRKEEVLTVTMRRGGKEGPTYQYPRVPEEIWVAFQASDSKGSYFNQHIRPQFTAQKL